MIDEEELYLPYYGNIEEAIRRGDEESKEKIMRWRADNIRVYVDDMEEELECRIELSFLDSRGVKSDSVCLEKFSTKSIKRNGLVVIPFGEKYILSSDITDGRNFIAIPIGNGIYSLTTKENYETKFEKTLYGIYTHIHWILKIRKPQHTYETFVKYSIARMLKEINSLVTGISTENVSKKLERSYQNRS